MLQSKVSLLLVIIAVTAVGSNGQNLAPCMVEDMFNVVYSCAEIQCPGGYTCVELRVPDRKLSIAQCFSSEAAAKYPTAEEYSCTSGFDVCGEGSNTVCVDIYENSSFLNVVCAPKGCSKDSDCPGILVCQQSPPYLKAASFPDSICSAPTKFEFGKDSCDSLDKGCNSAAGLACHDFIFKGLHVGTDCGPSAVTFVGESCSDLHCAPPLLECWERTIEGRGTLAQCSFRQSVDIIAKDIESIDDKCKDAGPKRKVNQSCAC